MRLFVYCQDVYKRQIEGTVLAKYAEAGELADVGIEEEIGRTFAKCTRIGC